MTAIKIDENDYCNDDMTDTAQDIDMARNLQYFTPVCSKRRDLTKNIQPVICDITAEFEPREELLSLQKMHMVPHSSYSYCLTINLKVLYL